MFFQAVSTPMPVGITSPTPVTTTLLFKISLLHRLAIRGKGVIYNALTSDPL
jgi:hypothetical protein